MSPLQYYFWMRKKYTPRVAAMAVLIRFCKSKEDLHRRINRWPGG